MRIRVIGNTPDQDFFTATSKPWSMFFRALKQKHEIVTSKIVGNETVSLQLGYEFDGKDTGRIEIGRAHV